jgi:hypothetical protein
MSIKVMAKKKEAKVLYTYFNIKSLAAAKALAANKDIAAHIIENGNAKEKRWEIVAHFPSEYCKYCDK